MKLGMSCNTYSMLKPARCPATDIMYFSARDIHSVETRVYHGHMEQLIMCAKVYYVDRSVSSDCTRCILFWSECIVCWVIY